MSYEWKKNADSKGPAYAEKMPNGINDVEITRLVFGKSDGTAFASKGGDPQIMVIFADNAGRECGSMYTLSHKAGWTLAKLLSALGSDLGRMEQDGVEPAHFADPAFATANLVGRRLKIDSKWIPPGNDGGKGYFDVVPINRPINRPVQAGQPAATPAPTTYDNIPI